MSKKRRKKNHKPNRFYGNDVISHYAQKRHSPKTTQPGEIRFLALQVFGSLYIDSKDI